MTSTSPISLFKESWFCHIKVLMVVFSESSSSGGDTEENIVAAAGENFPDGNNSRQHQHIREEEGGHCISSEQGTRSRDNVNGIDWIRNRCRDKMSDKGEGSETLREVEVRKKVVEAVEEAVKAVGEASNVVAGGFSPQCPL